jgi:hypothetical protein
VENTQLDSDVRRLAESLGKLPEPAAEPVLVIVSGLPGTGKSYFSKRLAERVSFLVLESDALRKALFASPTYSGRESARLFRAIHALVELLLRKGVPLIVDATNLSERFREPLYSIADRLGAKLLLVRVEAPPEVVRQRLERRSDGASDADWAVYRKMLSSVDSISRKHYAVDTSRDITPVLEKVAREATR